MSDSVRPHRRQPTRLPRPWDSPGKTLEWVAMSFSSAWKWKVKVKSFSRVWLLATSWTAAYQAPSSMGFSRQESGVGAIAFSTSCCSYPQLSESPACKSPLDKHRVAPYTSLPSAAPSKYISTLTSHSLTFYVIDVINYIFSYCLSNNIFLSHSLYMFVF